ncbi:hypothetical protein THAOC_11207 [Thalassiosira oceanica]|uniref:Pentacotripeptide-repeat region of PRORP domain-containing protein n=1 Tax=Thalassiosira oceanica TaxID=159749 RepID=K0SQU7_THAOC|nr:hypothetical protein THAOC_11207 [Thalassiosira oceanica]|eukprot:EJK67725.1 hypothetical protein THAOC_11207 [Thalassiosira oceanica]
MRLLDRMERLADELDMPSVRPNQRTYNVALSVIANSASSVPSSLDEYYESIGNKTEEAAAMKGENATSTTASSARRAFNPLHPGRAAESILSRMLSSGLRPNAYTFASVLNTYQRIPNGKLDAAMAADAVIRGMESLHLHGRIDDAPDVFHYTMACACWSRSGEAGVAGERCSEILRHMMERDAAGHDRVRPNIRTFNAVIDSHAYNGRVGDAEDMLMSMVDSYESSAARSMDGIEDEELPVRPDSFSFNTGRGGPEPDAPVHERRQRRRPPERELVRVHNLPLHQGRGAAGEGRAGPRAGTAKEDDRPVQERVQGAVARAAEPDQSHLLLHVGDRRALCPAPAGLGRRGRGAPGPHDAAQRQGREPPAEHVRLPLGPVRVVVVRVRRRREEGHGFAGADGGRDGRVVEGGGGVHIEDDAAVLRARADGVGTEPGAGQGRGGPSRPRDDGAELRDGEHGVEAERPGVLDGPELVRVRRHGPGRQDREARAGEPGVPGEGVRGGRVDPEEGPGRAVPRGAPESSHIRHVHQVLRPTRPAGGAFRGGRRLGLRRLLRRRPRHGLRPDAAPVRPEPPAVPEGAGRQRVQGREPQGKEPVEGREEAQAHQVGRAAGGLEAERREVRP